MMKYDEAVRSVQFDDEEARPPTLVPPPWDARQPDPLIWREPDPSAGTDWRDPLLAVGEVGVLAGPGGMGKSLVTVALAHAMGKDDDHPAACGLRVAGGRVVVCSYEDSGARIVKRMRWYGRKAEWSHVQLASGPEPLYCVSDGAAQPTQYFDELWAAIAAEGDVRLLVLDPVSVAYTGPPNDAMAVRGFIAALATKASDHNVGVLLVAHDTKAARDEVRRGTGDPGAGAVAGSSQWWDGSRSVLHLGPVPATPEFEQYAEAKALLRCAKSNYGPTGWGVLLGHRITADNKWHGIDPQPIDRV